VNVDALRTVCAGVVAAREDADFAELLCDGLWNRLVPDRAPDVLVRAADEQDVVAAVRFARENKLKVVVRGGGHNWCQPTLRNGGVLIDLSEMNKVVSIDVEARRAVVQPIVSNREIQRVLNERGLAFPSGHCPEVKISGYLLGGGMSWNQTVWGTGAESVEAIEMVTPQGELITASATENAEWFWAARGSGTGFFGVVTRFHLRLHPLPRAIHGSTYYFAIEDSGKIAGWLGALAPGLSPAIELTIFLLDSPMHLREGAMAHGGKICMVTATAFADSAEEAKAMLKPLEAAPANPVSREFATPATFEQLFDASGALWPRGLRNRVEAMFSNAPAAQLVDAVRTHVEDSPSSLTLVLFVIYCGPPLPLPDAAFSRSAAVYLGPWTMWKSAAADAANIAWHDECVRRLKPLVCGHYVGESDTVRDASHAPGCYSAESWRRIAELRAKYDPEGVFFGFRGGFGK